MRTRTTQLLALISALSLVTACGDKDDSSDPAAAQDTTPPVITLVGDDPLMVAFGGTFTDPGATASDDTDPVVDVIVSGEVDTSVLGDVIVSYDAVDSAGNEADTVTRTVSVVDMAGPVITLVGDNPLTIAEASVFEDPGATATDDVDGDVTVTVTGTVDPNLAGAYVLSYDAVDTAGNAAETVERVVQVEFEGQLALAANGFGLSLVGQRPDGTLVERATAMVDIGDARYKTNHQVFGIAVDPATGSVFTSSFNECGAAVLPTDGCWGNARIDRFSYDVNTLTHEGPVLLLQGPIRFGEVVVDETETEAVVALVNQGAEPLDIADVVLVSVEGSEALVSSCTGVTLAAGESCELSFTVDAGDDLYAAFEVDTGVGVASSSLYYDGWPEAYIVQAPGWGGEVDLELPGCALESWGYADQVGSCAPTALAISPDGTRIFVNDDSDDVGLVLSLDADGAVAFLSESEDRMSLQGVAVNGDGSAVYNGGSSFSTAGDVLVRETTHGGGNATEVFEVGGIELLVSTINNTQLAIFDLTAPLAPVLIDSVSPAEGRARYQHHSADGTRFVTIDHQDIVVYSFDGAELSELFSSEIPVTVDEAGCVDCAFSAYNRVVQVSADGTQAMTGVFVNAWDADTRGALPSFGQVRSFDVDATTGEATEVDTMHLPGMTRALLIVPLAE